MKTIKAWALARENDLFIDVYGKYFVFDTESMLREIVSFGPRERVVRVTITVEEE